MEYFVLCILVNVLVLDTLLPSRWHPIVTDFYGYKFI